MLTHQIDWPRNVAAQTPAGLFSTISLVKMVLTIH